MSFAPSSALSKKAATRQEIPIESVAEAANSVITHGVTVAKVSHDPSTSQLRRRRRV